MAALYDAGTVFDTAYHGLRPESNSKKKPKQYFLLQTRPD